MFLFSSRVIFEIKGACSVARYINIKLKLKGAIIFFGRGVPLTLANASA